MQARVVLRHSAQLRRSTLNFVPLFRPSIIQSFRNVHIPRSNIGRLAEEIFDTDAPVKPPVSETPLLSKPNPSALTKEVSHLLKYLDSSVSISLRIKRLRDFTLNLDPSQVHPSKPLVPLLLLRSLTFECTTFDDLISMARSVRVLRLQKAANNELCMAIINQCRDLARDNIGLGSDSTKDMNTILSTMSMMGVETDDFPTELKTFMVTAFKDIFKSPEHMGSFMDVSSALQASLRLNMDFTAADEFERSVMNCIAHQLQARKSATTKDLIAIITSITKSPRFMDPNSILTTDSSARATMVALIKSAFDSIAINATQSPMLGADFNLALNSVRRATFRNNINDALRVSIGKAMINALPLVEDGNLAKTVQHLVDLKMHRGYISPEAAGILMSEIEKRMTKIPLPSFAQILRGIFSLELESAIRHRRSFSAAVDSALPEMLSVFTGREQSPSTPVSSSQPASSQTWSTQSQESFVSMIHSFGKLPIKWTDLSIPSKNSLLQSWSRVLPVVELSGAHTMITAMSKMRVHYPNLLPHGLDATLVQVFQKMLDKNCSTYQLSAMWLSLGGMNAAWSHISEDMKTVLTACAHKMPMEESSNGVSRIAPDSLYGMGLMGMKWREMPLNTQRYLTRLLSQYWTLVAASTTNEATRKSLEQLLPTLVAGMGMMEMPLTFLDTIPRIPTSAAITINWEKILQNSHQWNGARVALLWNSVSHVDDATWSTIPVDLMDSLVRPIEASIQNLDNRSLTILMAATVRLAIDLPWEPSTRKARKVHRNVELNRVCNALLLELARREAAMKAQRMNGAVHKAAAPSTSTSTWNQVMLMQIRSFLLMMKQRVLDMSTSDPKSAASSPLIATWNTHQASWGPSFFSPETVIRTAKSTNSIQSVDDLQTASQGDSDRVQFHTVSKYHQTMSEMLRAALSKVDESMNSHQRRRARSHRDSDRFAVINEHYGLRWSVEDENTAVPDFAVDVAVFSSEQQQRPLAFVEINGPHHYIPVHTAPSAASSSTKKDESTPPPPAMKLRREDVVKEHFYRSVYPDIPLLRISAIDARPRHQIIDEMVETILQREAAMLEQLPSIEHSDATMIEPVAAVPSPYKGNGEDVRKPKVVAVVHDEMDDNDDKETQESAEGSTTVKSTEVKDDAPSEIDDFMALAKPRAIESQEKKKEKEFVTYADDDEEEGEDDHEEEDGEGEDFDEDEDEDEAEDEAGIEELENDFIDEDEEEEELDDEAMFARMVLEAEEEDKQRRQLQLQGVSVDDVDESVSGRRRQKQIPEKAKQTRRSRHKKNDESVKEDDGSDADDSDDNDDSGLPPPKYRLNI